MVSTRGIGTYDISIGSQQCRAAPKKPVTRARLEKILRIEGELGLRDLAMELADGVEIVRIRR